MRLRHVTAGLMLALAAAAAWTAEDEEDLHRREERCAAVVQEFREKDERMPMLFDSAYGYAVYPSVKKGGMGVGGAHGKGLVYMHGRLVGRSSLTQVTMGLQLGGQAYAEVVFLESRAAMDDFRRGHLKLDAQASAVALTARAAADVKYRRGVAIVTMAGGGLMYEASVGGQKFSFDPLD